MTGIPLNINLQQIMLHLFNFTILFGMLYILLYKPVKDFMEKREAYFRDTNDKAETALATAESDRKLYEEKLEGIDAEARASRDKTRIELEEMRAKKVADATTEAETIISDAKAEAAREKNKIIESAQKDITDIITDATEKLVLQQSSSEAFDQFLDAVEKSDKEEA